MAFISLCVQDAYQAQRALLKGGQVLGGRLMIGVKPLERQFRLATESLNGDLQGRLVGANPKRIVVRPQRLDQSLNQVCSISVSTQQTNIKNPI